MEETEITTEEAIRATEEQSPGGVGARIIPRSRLAGLVLVVAALIIGAFLLSPPWTVLGKAKLVGYAICHQIPERSFHIAGQQLPL